MLKEHDFEFQEKDEDKEFHDIEIDLQTQYTHVWKIKIYVSNTK